MKPILLRGHEKPINVVKFNFDGDLFFTGSADKRINLWSSFTGERLGSFTGSAAIKSLDVSDDSTLMISASMNGILEFWEALTGQLIGSIKKYAKAKYIEFALGDKEIVVVYESYGSPDNEVRIFNVEKILQLLKQKQELEDSKELSSHGFFIPEKKRLSQINWDFLNNGFIASTDDGYIMKLDLNGKVLSSAKVHDEINAFSIASDYSMILTAGRDGGRLLDLETLEEIRSFKQEFPMNAAAISPMTKEKNKPKYHAIIGGGIPARMAAKTKVKLYIF